MSQDLFDEAVRFEEQDELLALAAWRRLAEINPTRNVFLRLANISKHLGLMDDAENAFKQALNVDDHSVPALQGLGIIAIRRGNYQAAVSYLKSAAELKDDPATLSLLGVALRNTGNDLESEAAHRKVIRIDPKYEEAYFNLGVVLQDNRPAEAEQLFTTAIELDPLFACAHRELGFVLMKRGANLDAGRCLRKAVELAPRDGWAHIYLGTYLSSYGDAEDAIAEYQVAQQLDPEWDVPLWSLGNVYEHRLKDFDSAQSFYEWSLQLEPDSLAAQLGLGRLCKKRGQFDLARDYLNRVLLQEPSDRRARALIAEMDADAQEF